MIGKFRREPHLGRKLAKLNLSGGCKGRLDRIRTALRDIGRQYRKANRTVAPASFDIRLSWQCPELQRLERCSLWKCLPERRPTRREADRRQCLRRRDRTNFESVDRPIRIDATRVDEANRQLAVEHRRTIRRAKKLTAWRVDRGRNTSPFDVHADLVSPRRNITQSQDDVINAVRHADAKRVVATVMKIASHRRCARVPDPAIQRANASTG